MNISLNSKDRAADKNRMNPFEKKRKFDRKRKQKDERGREFLRNITKRERKEYLNTLKMRDKLNGCV